MTVALLAETMLTPAMQPVALPPALATRLRTSDWRVLVTGAGGWLGQVALEMLADALGEAWRSRVIAFGSRRRDLMLRDGRQVRQRPLADLPAMSRTPSLLLHFAYLTREKTTAMPLDAYASTNRALSLLAVDGGAAVGVERSFSISSGAVHEALARPRDADPRLLYGRLKLEEESLFERFSEAAPGRRSFVARLFNLSGPYINKLDSYALASFICQARDGCIQVRARHPVLRSYTSASNLLGVAMGQLLAEDASPFLRVETAGDRVVEVGELARMVRDMISPKATIDRAEYVEAPIDHYVGDGARYRKLLAEHGIPEHSLPRQIGDTAEYLDRLGPTPP